MELVGQMELGGQSNLVELWDLGGHSREKELGGH